MKTQQLIDAEIRYADLMMEIVEAELIPDANAPAGQLIICALHAELLDVRASLARC